MLTNLRLRLRTILRRHTDGRGGILLKPFGRMFATGCACCGRRLVFSATAIATIALATASIATVASLADALLWQRPHAQQPDRLVATSRREAGQAARAPSYPDYTNFRDRTSDGWSAGRSHYSTAPLLVDVDGNAKEVNGAVVSATTFRCSAAARARSAFFPVRTKTSVLPTATVWP